MEMTETPTNLDSSPASASALGPKMNNPAGEIKATCAPENLPRLLYGMYIHQADVTIDTTMIPPHILAVIPIHPNYCNKYVKHVAQMFLAWTGTMSFRFRIMANAFNGGSVRVLHLPPTLSRQQIQELDRPTLTSYTNMDIDPKCMEWQHFSPPDERNVKFHWMKDFNESDPSSFGGWAVFFLAGKLITGNTEAGNMTMLIESRGSFTFAQPSPLSSISPVNAGPLSEPVLKHLLDSKSTEGSSQDLHLQIIAGSVPTLKAGFTFSSGVGGKEPWKFINGDSISGGDELVRQINMTRKMDFTMVIYGEITDDENVYFENFTDNAHPQCLPLSICQLGFYTSKTTQGHDTQPDAVRKIELLTTGKHGFLRWQPMSDGYGTWCYIYPNDYVANTKPIDTDAVTIQRAGNKLSLAMPESFVVFVDTFDRFFSTQTEAMKRDLMNFRDHSPGTTYLYTLHSTDSPNPLMYLRLNENGCFSAPKQALTTIAFGDLSLRYQGTLPADSPLPVAPMARYYYLASLEVKATTGRQDPKVAPSEEDKPESLMAMKLLGRSFGQS